MLISTYAVSLALSKVGIVEEKPNRGAFVDLVQKEFGYQGVSYCMLFCLYCYKKASESLGLPFPFLKTASTQSFFTHAKERGWTYDNPTKMQRGDIVIWRKLKLWQGHAGIIYEPLDGDFFMTIEGNTSSGQRGSQSNGDGIYKRLRGKAKVDFAYDSFYIRGFVSIEKAFSQLSPSLTNIGANHGSKTSPQMDSGHSSK